MLNITPDTRKGSNRLTMEGRWSDPGGESLSHLAQTQAVWERLLHCRPDGRHIHRKWWQDSLEPLVNTNGSPFSRLNPHFRAKIGLS